MILHSHEKYLQGYIELNDNLICYCSIPSYSIIFLLKLMRSLFL